jgi:hypothetical protein
MKKLIALLLVASLGLFTVGCGGGDKDKDKKDAKPAAGEKDKDAAKPEGK